MILVILYHAGTHSPVIVHSGEKAGQKHKFKSPAIWIFILLQQHKNYRKELKDEPFNSKLSEKFSKLKNTTADALRKAKTEYYKNGFEEAKSLIPMKIGHLLTEYRTEANLRAA